MAYCGLFSLVGGWQWWTVQKIRRVCLLPHWDHIIHHNTDNT